MKAKTTAQKQRDFRARKIAQGLTEVRGIFAPPEAHAAIKEAARELVGAIPYSRRPSSRNPM